MLLQHLTRFTTSAHTYCSAMSQVVVQTSSAGQGAAGQAEFHDKLTVHADGFGNALEVPLAAHLPRPLLRVSSGSHK